MTGVFSSKPYDALANDLCAALEWLGSLGVPYERTRVGEYECAIEIAIASFRASNFDAIRDALLPILTALFEIHDLVDIHQSLAGKFDNEIKQHVHTYTKGPRDYTEEHVETSSNVARNIAFELMLMAKLTKAGLPLDFSIKSDVAAKFDNRSLLFECKRPQSEDALESNIKKAYRQLEKKYRSPQRLRHRGLIAIDITKLVNPDFMLYVQPNSTALDSGLSRVIDTFVLKHEHLWQRSRNAKTIGILLRLTIMGVNQEKNDMFTHCQQWAVTPMNHVGERNIVTARNLADMLARSLNHVV
ncbi:MAG: hypothetical protein ACRD5H_06275 [Nitrososphaerales archaeon]